jgi:hypothetical protein
MNTIQRRSKMAKKPIYFGKSGPTVKGDVVDFEGATSAGDTPPKEAGSADWAGEEGGGLEDAPVAQVPVVRIIQHGSRLLTRADLFSSPPVPGQIYIGGVNLLAHSIVFTPVFIGRAFGVFASAQDGVWQAHSMVKGRPVNAKWIEGAGYQTPQGSTVREIHYYYVVLTHPSTEPFPALIHFSRGALKVSWAWTEAFLSKYRHSDRRFGVVKPAWAASWEAKTVEQDDGKFRWFKWTPLRFVEWNVPGDSLHVKAKAFYQVASLHYDSLFTAERPLIEESSVDDEIPF